MPLEGERKRLLSVALLLPSEFPRIEFSGSPVFEQDTSRHSCITALPTTLLSFLCSPFCLPCSLFGCRCPFLSSIHAFPSSLHAFPGSLYPFLGPSCSAAPSRWPAWSTGRTRRTTRRTRRSANTPGRPAWPAGGAFYLTRRSFGALKTSTTRG